MLSSDIMNIPFKSIVRGDIKISEDDNYTDIDFDEIYSNIESFPYEITVDDLFAGVTTYLNSTAEEVYRWIDFLVYFEDVISFTNEIYENIEDEVKDKDILNLTYDELENLSISIMYDDFEPSPEDLVPIKDMLEVWIKSSGKEYPEQIKSKIASQYDEDNIDMQSPATQELFKQCLDYMCDVKKDPKSIQTRGYCYYCGTIIYPNDWIKARDSFIEYYKMTGDASAANTLGYIYYYGRCNNGVPEYDEAFKYFSIGHAYTYFESTYKLADMFAHGYGVVKDGKTANHLYWSVYNQTFKQFITGIQESKFADAALRIGNCYRDGIGVEKDIRAAYYFYLQADYAIRQRISVANHYGDTSVYTGIQKSLNSIRSEYTEHRRTLKFVYPGWIDWTLIDHRRCKLKIRKLKNGVLGIDASPVNRYDENEPPMMLITVPEADHCELYKKIRIKTAPNTKFIPYSDSPEIVFDHIEYDDERNKTSFYHFEALVAEIYSDFYTFTAPRKEKPSKSGEQYHFVSIRFEESGRAYDYLCNDKSIVPGDMVIVNGYNGETAVEVVDTFDKYESELGLPVERYKSIVRKAD